MTVGTFHATPKIDMARSLLIGCYERRCATVKGSRHLPTGGEPRTIKSMARGLLMRCYEANRAMFKTSRGDARHGVKLASRYLTKKEKGTIMSLNFAVMSWAASGAGSEFGVSVTSTLEEMEEAYRRAHPTQPKTGGKTHTARAYVCIVRREDEILAVCRGATIEAANEAAARFALQGGHTDATVSPIPVEDFDPGEKSSAWTLVSGPPQRGRKPGQSVKPDLSKVSREDLLAALEAAR